MFKYQWFFHNIKSCTANLENEEHQRESEDTQETSRWREGARERLEEKTETGQSEQHQQAGVETNTGNNKFYEILNPQMYESL